MSKPLKSRYVYLGRDIDGVYIMFSKKPEYRPEYGWFVGDGLITEFCATMFERFSDIRLNIGECWRVKIVDPFRPIPNSAKKPK